MPCAPSKLQSNQRMENRAIARLLYETADLMEVDGADSFRIRSYRNAAGAIESYPEPISQILKDPTRKVTEIPGIGKGIASVLGEIEQHDPQVVVLIALRENSMVRSLSSVMPPVFK